MKRSSCLSALLVGLSVMTGSVAFAAPPVAVAQTKVAQANGTPELGSNAAQVSDPAPSGSAPTAPADPSAAASDPAAAGNAPTAAITIGSANTTPGADTPQTAAAGPAKKPAPRRWAGTQVYTQTSMSTATVFRGQQQNYNPSVSQAIFLLPRFTLSDAFQIRGRMIFSYEFTNADDTVTRNEPRFSDTTLSLFYRKIPELPGGIHSAIALNAGLPSSPESRARTMIVAPGASVQFVKQVEHVLGGELMFLAIGSYSHPFYRSTTAELRTPSPYAFSCVGGTSCTDQLGGTFNTSDSLIYALLIGGEWGKWSPALYYLGGSQWAYSGKEVQYQGRPVEAPAGFSPTTVRQTSYFSAWLDYNANTWFTAEVGWMLSRAALSEDGTRGNPFFDRYQDQRVYFGMNFNIDNIMKQLEGGATEGGIVRAQNERRPIMNF